ncbi:hypothetical protein LZ24_01778 [Desulfobotulus alkaliphilus]|uniref:Uncharacterized protein n=1 Tax=Desulfobotulus alkaliphilus TaxID=622671 RepID=A0A562RRT8_9BACT|nr:hypothetical protein [Desulfobotulus alkaliphilus]TWI71762.1 hypothetical protein LZ24_01778 [Desulfobotulus alkaliphilus]
MLKMNAHLVLIVLAVLLCLPITSSHAQNEDLRTFKTTEGGAEMIALHHPA